MTGAYNNFFRMFDRAAKRDVTLEASKEIAKPKTILKPRKVNLLYNFITTVIILYTIINFCKLGVYWK